MPSLTSILASYAVETKYESLPENVIEMAKLVTLDALGCALGGYTTAAGKIYVNLAKDMGVKDESAIIGDGNKVACMPAAFANAHLVDILDFQDTALHSHPSAVVIPAALAVGERIRASGKEFIASVIVGYDVFGRIWRAAQSTRKRYEKVWGPASYLPFAAVVPAGKLLNLNKTQMETALGIAGAYSPVPSGRKLVQRPLSEIKDCFGWGCMAGVLAALSAQKGLVGFSAILDGDTGFWRMAGSDRCDFDLMTKGLGEEYEIMKTAFKPYPSCRYTHSSLDAVKSILQEHKIEAKDIKQINVSSFSALKKFFSHHLEVPVRMVDAEWNLPYAIAMIVMGEEPGLNWFTEEKLKDPKVHSIANRVKVKTDPKAEKLRHKEHLYVSTVEILTKDGKRFSKYMEHAKGDPENPLTYNEIKSKFRRLASHVLEMKKVKKVIKTVEELEQLDNVSRLTGALHP